MAMAPSVKVAAFASMDDLMLRRLRDRMSEEPFEDGEVVFHQGDAGEAFYVILSGRAQAIRYHEDGRDEILAVMEEGSCFGERALLKDEPRFASVRAHGADKLRTMSITREAFESEFGPLQNLISADGYGEARED